MLADVATEERPQTWLQEAVPWLADSTRMVALCRGACAMVLSRVQGLGFGQWHDS